MSKLIDALPAWARASTTGQGIAGFAATAAAAVAGRYTQNTEIIGAVGVLAAAVVLLIFPQATGAPAGATAVAASLKPIIDAFGAGLAHGVALAPAPQAASSVTLIVPSTSTQETSHA